MSIEGGSIGIASSVGGAGGVEAASFGAASTLNIGPLPGSGFLSGLGKPMGLADIGPIFNEGPIKGGLEAMPNQITIFNPAIISEPVIGLAEQVPSVIQQVEAVAQAAWGSDTSVATLIAIYGNPEAFGIFQPQPVQVESTLAEVVPAPAFFPASEPEIVPLSIVQTINRDAPRIFPAVLAQADKVMNTQIRTLAQTVTRIESQSAQVVATPVTQAVEVVGETIPESQKEEVIEIKAQQKAGVEKSKVMHVIDRKAATRRISRILSKALQIAAGLTTKPQKIRGYDLTIGLPTSNKQEIRGEEINRKDPQEILADKTWDATLKELNSLEFDSLEHIEGKVPEIVLDNHPVRVATIGEQAAEKNVVKSHQRRDNHAHLEFERRKRLKKEHLTRISKDSQQPAQVIAEEEKVIEEEDPIEAQPELAEALGVKTLTLTG